MTVLNYLDRQTLSIVAPLMLRDLGVSLTGYTQAVNAFLFAYGLMYVGSGVILDRVGARAGLAIFVGFWSLFSGLHCIIAGVGSMIAFRFLLGVAEPGGFTGAVKAISEQFGASQRALATGIFTSGAGIGSIIAVPLIVFLSLRVGWRMAFALPALAGLIWVPLWLLANRGADRRLKSLTVAAVPSFSVRLRLLGNRHVFSYVLSRFFGDSTGYFFMFWMPAYLVSSKHFSYVMLGTLGWIPACGIDAGALLGGYASSRLVSSAWQPIVARKTMMTLAAVLVAMGSILQVTANTGWVIASLTLCTFGVGVWAANLHCLPADAFSRPVVATVHGLAGTAGAIGGVLFNTLVGYFTVRNQYMHVFLLFASLQPLGVAALWKWLHSTAPDASPIESEVINPI